MNFNSIQYAIFLPIVFALYWAIPHKARWVLLLIASYYFYMSWNPKYVVLILATTFVSYLAGRLLEDQKSEKKKKLILAGTLIVCLGILFFFKYFNFVSQSVVDFCKLFTIQLHPVTLAVLLPVGISFYTFQTLSYVIDVYKGTVKPEKNFGIYATFISFFPQLVAGPIERTSNLLPQIKSEKKFDYDKATYGMVLMAWGFFKKIAIADNLAVYVDATYTDLRSHTGYDLLIAVLFFTIQIYCDFSGYSDIAIGTAKLLGIDLMTNFKSPYFATSVREHWGRWHISLSTWFKDYVYIPMGGNRCSKARNYFNIMITFLVSGLWHGAAWTYVIWGSLHGFAQVLEKIFSKPIKKFKSNKLGMFLSLVIVYTFINYGFIVFRAENMSDAFYVMSHMFEGISSPATYMVSHIGLSKLRLVTLLFTIFVLALYDYFSMKFDVIEKIKSKPWYIRYAAYAILLLLIMNFRSSGNAEFVYFQF